MASPLLRAFGPLAPRRLRRLPVASPPAWSLPQVLGYLQTASETWMVLEISLSRAGSFDGSIIRNCVRNVSTKVKAAGMLRLVFHDAGTFHIGDKPGKYHGVLLISEGLIESIP